MRYFILYRQSLTRTTDRSYQLIQVKSTLDEQLLFESAPVPGYLTAITPWSAWKQEELLRGGFRLERGPR